MIMNTLMNITVSKLLTRDVAITCYMSTRMEYKQNNDVMIELTSEPFAHDCLF